MDYLNNQILLTEKLTISIYNKIKFICHNTIKEVTPHQPA